MSKTPTGNNKNTGNTNTNTKTISVLEFKPRQVTLLLSSTMTTKPDNKTTSSVGVVLSPEQKTHLQQSVAVFLQTNNFSKTLKKFLSEANLQKDDLKDVSFNLEEVFCEFLENCHQTSKKSHCKKLQDLKNKGVTENGDGDSDPAAETSGDRKKKGNSESDRHSDKKSGNVEEAITDDAAPKEKKQKEKKSKKKISDAHGEEEQVTADLVKEPTDKKKKKNKLPSDSTIDNCEKNEEVAGKKKKKASTSGNSSPQDSKLDAGKLDHVGIKKDDAKPATNDVTGKKKAGSKKRKRSASEDDATHVAEKPVDETKRRKAESSEEPRATEQSNETKSSTSQNDGQTNGVLENDGENTAMQKKNKRNGSAEPKTVTRFQRVKIDEVVFSDKRLQDNSYWAKDGAENGYGAKAQGILEQVKGRGFRHEKTKKKRGTYRGGEIDLQSHSVKFNYSDDE